MILITCLYWGGIFIFMKEIIVKEDPEGEGKEKVYLSKLKCLDWNLNMNNILLLQGEFNCTH